MKLGRTKLYLILFTACLAGYIWLFFNITNNLSDNKSVETCLIKRVTSIPCPSCGSTRAVISLTNGNIVDALKLNPFGFIIAFIMLLTPLWIVTDLITKNNSLVQFYYKLEIELKKPKYAIPLILLVIINWIWNITKGL